MGSGEVIHNYNVQNTVNAERLFLKARLRPWRRSKDCKQDKPVNQVSQE